MTEISTTWRFVWRVLGRAGQFVGTAIIIVGQLSPIATVAGLTLLFLGAILDVGLELLASK